MHDEGVGQCHRRVGEPPGADPGAGRAVEAKNRARVGRGDVVDVGHEDKSVDKAVALDHVVTQLPEDLVVTRATGEVVVAPQVGSSGLNCVAVVQQGDGVLGAPPRVVLAGASDERVSVGAARDVGAIDLGSEEGAHPRVEEVGAAAAVGVVAGDEVIAGSAVDEVVAVEGTGDVGAADEQVVAALSIDDVVALLAHDDVVSLTGEDDVVARAGVRGDVGGAEVDRPAEVDAQSVARIVRVVGRRGAADPALVAEDQVVAAVAIDHVVAGAAEEDVARLAAIDRVRTTVEVAEPEGLDDADEELVHREAGEVGVWQLGVGRETGTVSEGEVPALADPDHVVANTADDDVIACTCSDRVGAAEAGRRRVGRHHLDVMGVVGDHAVAQEVVDEAVVTEDDVVAVKCVRSLAAVDDDRVAAGATEDHVAPEAGGDRVRASELTDGRDVALDELEDRHLVVVVRVGGRQGRGHGAVEDVVLHTGDPTVVAEDDVLSVARIDGVALCTTGHDVVAEAGRDGVDATLLLVDALDEVQDRDARGALEVEHPTVVAEDDVGLAVTRDRVVAVASEDPVTATVAGDDVVRAVLGAGVHDLAHATRGLDLLELDRPRVAGGPDDGLLGVLTHAAVVTKDDVVELVDGGAGAANPVAVEHVLSGDKVVAVREDARVAPRDGQLAGDDVDVDAVVAIDLVTTAATDDEVVAGTAHQEVRCGTADDRVVAGTAIRGEADRREGAGGDPNEKGRGVDDVVSGIHEGVGDGEDEAGVPIADLVREGLVAEGEEGLHARVAAVPLAVLRGVSVDDEGRVRARTAGDDERVATDAGRPGFRVARGDRCAGVAADREAAAGDGQGVAGHRGHGTDDRAVDRQDLPDDKAGAGPRDPVVANQRAGGRTGEGADDLDERVAAAVHGGDAAVDRDASERAVGVVIPAGDKGARDVEMVIALAEQEVEDLDGRVGRGWVEGSGGGVEDDRAVADAGGEGGRLTERHRRTGADQVREVQRRGVHAQAGDRRGGERALQVFLAGVGVDVEHVDLLSLRRLLRDLEQGSVALTGEQHGRAQRAVGAGGAALDSKGATDAREEVGALGERLEVLLARLEDVPGVGHEVDGDGLPPVERGEGDDGGPLHDGEDPAEGVGRARHGGQGHEVEDATGAAADALDLVAVAQGSDFDLLALEEASVEPALTVGAVQGAGGGVVGDIPGVDTAGDDPAEHRRGEGGGQRCRAGPEDQGERRAVGRDRVDDVVVAGAVHRQADVLSRSESFVPEVAQRGVAGAGQLRAVDGQRTAELPVCRFAADRLVGHPAAVGDDIRLAVGHDRDIDGSSGAGVLGGTDLVGVPRARAGGRVASDDQGLASTLDDHDAGGVVVEEEGVKTGGEGTGIRTRRCDRGGVRVLTDEVVDGDQGDEDTGRPVASGDEDVVDAGDADAAWPDRGERAGGCGDGHPVVAQGQADGDVNPRVRGEADEHGVGETGGGGALDEDRGAVRCAGAVLLHELDGRQVVVADGGLDVADHGRIEERVGADDRVADHDDPGPLGEGVVDGHERDRLGTGLVPGGGREEENHRIRRDGDELAVDPDHAVVGCRGEHGDALGKVDGVATGCGLGGGRAWRRHRHIDVGRRALCEIDDVGVGTGRAFTFTNGREPAGLLDDDLSLGASRHDGVDSGGSEPVIQRVGRADVVVDGARGALDVAGDDTAGHVTGDVDDVAAEATDDAGGHSRSSGEDVKQVVALKPVDLEDLDVGVGDCQAGSVDGLGRHDDVVGELGAQHHDLVDAVAAVDGDGGVDVVLHLVVAGAGADLGGRRGREQAGSEARHGDLVRGVAPDDLAGGDTAESAGPGGQGQGEGPDDELVIAVISFEPQRGLVRVDDERVIPGASLSEQRLAHTG